MYVFSSHFRSFGKIGEVVRFPRCTGRQEWSHLVWMLKEKITTEGWRIPATVCAKCSNGFK